MTHSLYRCDLSIDHTLFSLTLFVMLQQDTVAEPNDEFELMVFGALRTLLGAAFVSHFRDYFDEIASTLRRMADVFTDLLKRYTISEFVMEGFCLHLSRNVWLDLTAASSIELSTDAVEDIDFRFTAQLEQSDLDSLKANTNGTTALEICTIMTKRVLAGLCKELLQEARRRLFNSKTMADVMVSTLILPPPDDACNSSNKVDNDDDVNKSLQVQHLLVSATIVYYTETFLLLQITTAVHVLQSATFATQSESSVL
jgi:hypothetical protein